MQKKYRYILAAGLAIAVLTACGNKETPAPETPESYGINTTSMENSEQQDGVESGYEIDDILPRPSDDTRIISVEEAEAIMNNRKNTDVDTNIDKSTDTDIDRDTDTDADTENGTEQKSGGSEYEIDDMLPRPSDDTLIMSVEEAEAFMKNKANIYSDVDKELSD